MAVHFQPFNPIGAAHDSLSVMAFSEPSDDIIDAKMSKGISYSGPKLSIMTTGISAQLSSVSPSMGLNFKCQLDVCANSVVITSNVHLLSKNNRNEEHMLVVKWFESAFVLINFKNPFRMILLWKEACPGLV